MKIGVIGAGTMGAGIAQCFAAAQGYTVVLCDIKEEFAENGRKKIAAALGRQLEKGKITQTAFDDTLQSLTIGLVDAVADCDLVIEAVVEDMRIKKELFAQLTDICGERTIFASNTSSLSLTEMGCGLDRPVIGMHFFNPAPVMKLVEVIITGLREDDAVVEKVMTVLDEIGKTPIQVKEGGGFVVNRILIPMINEAIGIYADGLASAEDIDMAMKLGANHPIGPLALGDLIGLDVCLAIMEVLQAEFGDPKYRPHPLLRKMVRAGLLGQKQSKGFIPIDPLQQSLFVPWQFLVTP